MDLENAYKDPAAEFELPRDVLNDERLSHEQKKAILEQWKRDAVQLEVAASENMAGGEPNMLHRVSEALQELTGQGD